MSNDGWFAPDGEQKSFGQNVIVKLHPIAGLDLAFVADHEPVWANLLKPGLLPKIPPTKQNAETIGLALAALIDTIEGLKR